MLNEHKQTKGSPGKIKCLRSFSWQLDVFTRILLSGMSVYIYLTKKCILVLHKKARRYVISSFLDSTYRHNWENSLRIIFIVQQTKYFLI